VSVCVNVPYSEPTNPNINARNKPETPKETLTANNVAYSTARALLHLQNVMTKEIYHYDKKH